MNKYSLISLLISSTILIACNSGTIRSDQERVDDYRTFKVEKIGNTKYFVAFKGTPLTTVEEARVEWDHKAKQVCGGIYQYLGDNYDSYEYNEDSGIAETSLKYDRSAQFAAACSLTGALSCIIADMVVGDHGNKEYPIINGTVECSKSSSPEEELANTSGHESIPYAPPDGCVWLRDSDTKEYVLDC